MNFFFKKKLLHFLSVFLKSKKAVFVFSDLSMHTIIRRLALTCYSIFPDNFTKKRKKDTKCKTRVPPILCVLVAQCITPPFIKKQKTLKKKIGKKEPTKQKTLRKIENDTCSRGVMYKLSIVRTHLNSDHLKNICFG